MHFVIFSNIDIFKSLKNFGFPIAMNAKTGTLLNLIVWIQYALYRKNEFHNPSIFDGLKLIKN